MRTDVGLPLVQEWLQRCGCRRSLGRIVEEVAASRSEEEEGGQLRHREG